jgi:hypothetical protein
LIVSYNGLLHRIQRIIACQAVTEVESIGVLFQTMPFRGGISIVSRSQTTNSERDDNRL